VPEAATIYPRPCKLIFNLLTLKVVSESRGTWASSVPILVFLGLSYYAALLPSRTLSVRLSVCLSVRPSRYVNVNVNVNVNRGFI